MLSKLVCTLWAASALAERAEVIIRPKLTQEQVARKKESTEGFFEVQREMRSLSAERLRELEERGGLSLVVIDPAKRMSSSSGSSMFLTERADLCREEIDQLNTALNAVSWVDKAYVGRYNPNPPAMTSPTSDFLFGGGASSMPPEKKPEEKKYELR
jgi:hypothetical protein